MSARAGRPSLPAINIGDAELGRARQDDPDDAEAADRTLVNRQDVDFTSMEQRCGSSCLNHRLVTAGSVWLNDDLDAIADAEALAENEHIKDDRDELAKPEGMYPPKRMSHEQEMLRKNASGASTPDTETDFDWDEADSSDEEEREALKEAKEEELVDRHRHNVKRAKRLRKVYLACMHLSRPFRTFLMALIGGAILITPAVVVWARFGYDNSSSRARDNVKVWSIWTFVLWTSACGTSIFVDAIPWIASKICVLLVGLYPQAIKSKVTCKTLSWAKGHI